MPRAVPPGLVTEQGDTTPLAPNFVIQDAWRRMSAAWWSRSCLVADSFRVYVRGADHVAILDCRREPSPDELRRLQFLVIHESLECLRNGLRDRGVRRFQPFPLRCRRTVFEVDHGRL